MRSFQLYDYQKQIVIGTLLGTSCVRKHPKGKNHSLYMRATDDSNWFKVKCKHLEIYARDPYSLYNKTWESCSHEIWNEFRDICYVNGKKTATMRWLDMLTDNGLATWFLDKGGICGNRAYIRLANLNDYQVAIKWFNEVGYPCYEKKKIAVFDVEAARKLLRNVTPCFPKYLLDRANPYRIRKYL